jgi:hypothetical protein
MPNQKNENSNNNTNNKNQFKNLQEESQQKSNNKVAAQQNQYLDNRGSSPPSSSNIPNTINKYQQQQKETINTIQSLSDNYIDLQQNLFTTFQSSFSKFIDEMFKSYCHNFIFPTTYSSLYSKSNQNIVDNAIKNTRAIHEFIVEYIETFNKSIEIAQKYYSDGIKNYLLHTSSSLNYLKLPLYIYSSK